MFARYLFRICQTVFRFVDELICWHNFANSSFWLFLLHYGPLLHVAYYVVVGAFWLHFRLSKNSLTYHLTRIFFFCFSFIHVANFTKVWMSSQTLAHLMSWVYNSSIWYASFLHFAYSACSTQFSLWCLYFWHLNQIKGLWMCRSTLSR